jgi:hypothetical protein
MITGTVRQSESVPVRFNFFAMVLALVLATAVSAETRLLMAEEPGCMWCARWNEDIAHIYSKTEEGRAAPLQRFDIREGAPDDVTLDRKVQFTPTFVLVHNGVEAGRIEGYPGEDFFWGLLGRLLVRAGIDTNGSG